MQRKTLYLGAAALVVVAAVAAVMRGGDAPREAKAPAPPAAKPAPAAPESAPKPYTPWTFAPRRPVDDTAPVPGATGAPGAVPGGPGATQQPGMPTNLLPHAAPAPGAAPPWSSVPSGAPSTLPAPSANPQAGAGFFSPGSGVSYGPPNATCPRGTLVRTGTSGPEIFCAP